MMEKLTYTSLGFLFIGMAFATGTVAIAGEVLEHRCQDPADNLQRMLFRDACHTLAVDSGYRMGVFRPCDAGDISCARVTVCLEPEVNYVCIGYSPTRGDCTTNADCVTGFFCKKEQGDCMGRGVCEEIPLDGGCPDEIDPVCGCDDITYLNSCKATQAGVNIRSIGACR